MIRKFRKLIFLSLCAFCLYLWKKEQGKPIFHPFGVNWAVTDESLEEAGYSFDVFEGDIDVAALGKKVGDTLLYYCLEYDCITINEEKNEMDCIFKYANYFYASIKLSYYDSAQVRKMIANYGGKIIDSDGHEKHKLDTTAFWVAYPDTSHLFLCTVSKPHYDNKNYTLTIHQSNPVYLAMQQRKWESGEEEKRNAITDFFRVLGYYIRKKLG